MTEEIEKVVLKKLHEYIKINLEDEAPTNVMGNSTSTGSPIAGFDPVMKLKLRRKLPKLGLKDK